MSILKENAIHYPPLICEVQFDDLPMSCIVEHDGACRATGEECDTLTCPMKTREIHIRFAPEENVIHFPPDAPEGYEWRRVTRWEAEVPEWYLSSVESCSMVDKENAQ